MNTIRFIHMSDIHYRKEYKNSGFEALISAKQHPEVNIIKCIQEEKKQGLDFVLITGDLTHEGERSDYQALARLLEDQLGDIPYILLPGNHDKRKAYQAVFSTQASTLAETYTLAETSTIDAVYNIKGLRIITLDSGYCINGIIHNQQLHWLKEILSKPSKLGTLLALHHPLIPNQEGLECAAFDKELCEIIKNSDILGIFCGHTHHNYLSQFAGKPYFTSDSIAFSMTTIDDVLQFENQAAYNLVTLSDGILSAQVRQVIPAIDVIASFTSDKLSQLFSK
ncbi:metallophosphoesterase [Anaerocolumna cellulosilytica]|uniref:Metallophosphoesterase n=1 Tax=Anaerocolumna cellulosilytica TaxID=433286 RepID=A0A6S6RAP8_9FIRM|nr:metallophosphoesterase [Anaerocolumna cellulosilytica]MBB5195475.1 3',5'-cyclic AMP phosphodiesterase CpdA [Anaerocolumna cellulosilytica]BCJ96008.1 metallophosphoesterase [Anaerocolumna cellulosilytica]